MIAVCVIQREGTLAESRYQVEDLCGYECHNNVRDGDK